MRKVKGKILALALVITSLLISNFNIYANNNEERSKLTINKVVLFDNDNEITEIETQKVYKLEMTGTSETKESYKDTIVFNDSLKVLDKELNEIDKTLTIDVENGEWVFTQNVMFNTDGVFEVKDSNSISIYKNTFDLNTKDDGSTEEAIKDEGAKPSSLIETQSGNVGISRFTIYTNPEKDTYLSGEEVLAYIGIALTDDSGVLSNSFVEIEIPKKHIVVGSFEASDITSQISKTVTETEDVYRVRYELAPLASGTSIDAPIKFKTENGNTPKGFTITPVAKLTSGTGDQIVEPATKVFTIDTSTPVLDKMVRQQSNSAYTNANNSNVDAGEVDASDPTKLSSDLTKLKNVDFTYRLIANSSSTANGSRTYEEIIFEDTIPAGAVFVEADNPGWTYDETTRVARYSYKQTNGTRLYAQTIGTLKLKFPEQEIDSVHTNSVKVELVPKDSPSYEENINLEDSITFRLKPTVKSDLPTNITFGKGNVTQYYDYQVDRDKTQSWVLTVGNTALAADHPETKLENVVIVDNKLDSALKYTGFRFHPTVKPVGTISVYVNYKNGTRLKVASEITQTTTPRVDFTDQENIDSVEIHFDEGTYLAAGTQAVFYVETSLKDKTSNVLSPTDTSKVMYNWANVKANYNHSSTPITGERNSYITYVRNVPKAAITKTITSQLQNYFINNTVRFNLVASAYQILPNETSVKANKIVDILPNGLEYVAGSSQLTISALMVTDMQKGTYRYEPEIITNYMGTGQTALVWDIKEYKISGTSIYGSFNSHTITYDAKIKELTRQGINTNKAILSWENITEVVPYTRAVDDIYDINENGRVDDKIAESTVTFNYVPPRELMIRKEVVGSMDANYMLPPNNGMSEIGNEASYKFTLYNNSISDISTLNILDVLPTSGDKTVSVDMSLESPQRVERGSTFDVTLTEAVSVPTGYKVFYSTESISDDVEAYYTGSHWVDSLEDYSQAKAIKITLDNGHILRSGEEVNVYINVTTPEDYTLTADDKAVNSFGVATTSALNFFESNLSTLTIQAYKVKGNVFDDFGYDGIYMSTQEDPPFENYLVTLVDELGNTVKDRNGDPYEVRTNAEGYYEIDVYEQGKYKIKVLTPEGFEPTQYSPDTNGSNISNAPYTETFELSRRNIVQIKNAGFYKDTVTLIIEKNLEDKNGLPFNSDIPFEFELRMRVRSGDDLTKFNGLVTKVNKITQEKQTVTVEDGKIMLSANERIVIEGIQKRTHYAVREIVGERFKPITESFSALITRSTVNVTFTNRVVEEKTAVVVEKEWVDGLEKRGDVKVQLYRNDIAVTEPVTLLNAKTQKQNYAGITPEGDVEISDSNKTRYEWLNLDLYDEQGHDYVYSVKEIEGPDNFVATITPLADETIGFLITNTYSIPKTKVSVLKKWVGGPETHPSIDVQLFQDGVAFGDVITLINGETKHTWEDLDLTDIDGNDHVYTVNEMNPSRDYIVLYDTFEVKDFGVDCNIDPDVVPCAETEDSLSLGNRTVVVITNEFIPREVPTIDYTVTKEWVGGPTVHPQIKIQLYRDGVAYGDAVVLENGMTQYTWKGLQTKTLDGRAYAYTVDEVMVPENYIKSIKGNTITNTYKDQGKFALTATKVWVKADAVKPDIEFQLYQNGVAYGQPVRLVNGVTEQTWFDLPLLDANGNLYVYTIDETMEAKGYKKVVLGHTVVNTKDDGKNTNPNDNNNGKGTLPSTGVSNNTMFYGFIAILIGVAGLFVRRRNDDKHSDE